MSLFWDAPSQVEGVLVRIALPNTFSATLAAVFLSAAEAGVGGCAAACSDDDLYGRGQGLCTRRKALSTSKACYYNVKAASFDDDLYGRGQEL